MKKLTFTTYAKENGGRVTLLFLLFLLAMYELVTAGFPVFAIICLLPVVFIAVIACFRSGILLFWFLIVINYLIMWKEIPLGSIPTSLPNEMIEIFLLALAIINVQFACFSNTLCFLGVFVVHHHA